MNTLEIIPQNAHQVHYTEDTLFCLLDQHDKDQIILYVALNIALVNLEKEGIDQDGIDNLLELVYKEEEKNALLFLEVDVWRYLEFYGISYDRDDDEDIEYINLDN